MPRVSQETRHINDNPEMRKKLTYTLLMAAFMACFMVSCDKEESSNQPASSQQGQNGQQGKDGTDDNPDDQPTEPNGEAPDANVGADNIKDEVVTGGCAELGATHIVLYGYVNNATPSQMGIIYDTDQNFSDKKYAYSTAFDPGTSNRRFHVSIEGLDKGQKYFYYAFIIKNNLEYTAEEIYSFTMKDGGYKQDDVYERPVFGELVQEPNPAKAGEDVTLTFTQTRKGNGIAGTTYTWIIRGLDTDEESGDRVDRMIEVRTNYDGYDKQDPTVTFTVPADATEGLYSVELTADFSCYIALVLFDRTEARGKLKIQ